MKLQSHFASVVFLIFALLPVLVKAQTTQHTESATANKAALQSDVVTLKASSDGKMDASMHATDTAFLLTLAGTGTGTVDVNNEAVLWLDNDSTVVARSIAFQGFESKNFVNTYKHEYRISQEGLEMLSRHNVRRLRKYAMTDFKDITVDESNASNLKTLAASFLEQLDQAHLLKPKSKPVSPAFPGGNNVFLAFLNRNLKLQSPLPPGEKKEASVQFQVGADGSVSGIQITQSAGPQYDIELLRVLKRMPHWKPALDNGRQVTALVTQPLKFYLQDSTVKVQF